MEDLIYNLESLFQSNPVAYREDSTEYLEIKQSISKLYLLEKVITETKPPTTIAELYQLNRTYQAFNVLVQNVLVQLELHKKYI